MTDPGRIHITQVTVPVTGPFRKKLTIETKPLTLVFAENECGKTTLVENITNRLFIGIKALFPAMRRLAKSTGAVVMLDIDGQSLQVGGPGGAAKSLLDGLPGGGASWPDELYNLLIVRGAQTGFMVSPGSGPETREQLIGHIQLLARRQDDLDALQKKLASGEDFTATDLETYRDHGFDESRNGKATRALKAAGEHRRSVQARVQAYAEAYADAGVEDLKLKKAELERKRDLLRERRCHEAWLKHERLEAIEQELGRFSDADLDAVKLENDRLVELGFELIGTDAEPETAPTFTAPDSPDEEARLGKLTMRITAVTGLKARYVEESRREADLGWVRYLPWAAVVLLLLLLAAFAMRSLVAACGLAVLAAACVLLHARLVPRTVSVSLAQCRERYRSEYEKLAGEPVGCADDVDLAAWFDGKLEVWNQERNELKSDQESGRKVAEAERKAAAERIAEKRSGIEDKRRRAAALEKRVAERLRAMTGSEVVVSQRGDVIKRLIAERRELRDEQIRLSEQLRTSGVSPAEFRKQPVEAEAELVGLDGKAIERALTEIPRKIDDANRKPEESRRALEESLHAFELWRGEEGTKPDLAEEDVISRAADAIEDLETMIRRRRALLMGLGIANRVIAGMKADEALRLREHLASPEVTGAIKQLTGGLYEGVCLQEESADEDGEKRSESRKGKGEACGELMALRRPEPGEEHPDLIEFQNLSTAARDQIMLALRLGMARRLTGGARLFLILDDAFQHMDYTRRQTAVDQVVRLVRDGWQVIYLTMDEHLRELFREAGKALGEGRFGETVLRGNGAS